jgi:hypothetical protein
MHCLLCREEKPLLKKSHIIPDFMYKGLYGPEHKLVQINLDNPKEKKIRYSGFYQGNILCRECDSILLSGLETYVSAAIFGRGNSKTKQQIRVESIISYDGFQSERYHNLDYTKVKLFFLSIIWRAHISSQPFFSGVDLGVYGEKIRKMLLAQDAGKEDELETCLVRIKPDETMPYRSLVDFRKLKNNSNSFYVFHMDNMMYHFNISRYRKESIFEKGRVRKDGTMDIGLLGNHIAKGYFKSFLGKG